MNPPPERSGPTTPDQAAANTLDSSAIVAAPYDVPAGLRRRRDAAERCEPLDDGHRDPWGPIDWSAVLNEPPDWGDSAVFRDGRMIAVRDLAVIA